MQYLRLRRSQAILACFVVSSSLLVAFPAIDIFISGLFFHDGEFLSRTWWQVAMHEGLAWALLLTLIAIIAIYISNRVRKRHLFGICGRRVVYLLLVLIIGAGLIVNVTFKENFGRARPRAVAEFGGSKQYTPPFVVSDQCSKNCSFSSGEGAGGFFAIALAMALSRRRAPLVWATLFGTWVSLCRIAAGAHFLSDTVVSFFVMFITADVLYFYMLSGRAVRAMVPIPAARLVERVAQESRKIVQVAPVADSTGSSAG